MDRKKKWYIVLFTLGCISLIFGLFQYIDIDALITYVKDNTVILTFPASLIFFIVAQSYRGYNKRKDIISLQVDEIIKYKKNIDAKITNFNKRISDFQSIKENIIYSKFLELDMSELSYIDKVFLSKQEDMVVTKDDLDKECTKNHELAYFIRGISLLHEFQETSKNSQEEVLNENDLECLKKADYSFNCAIKKASGRSDYVAEYWNYRGLTWDYGKDYKTAVKYYLNSIEKNSYEKPYFNIACTLSLIYLDAINNSHKHIFYKDIHFTRIKSVINSYDHLLTENANINLDIDNVKSDKNDFLEFCFIASVKALNISIKLRPSNIMVALKKEENELLVFHEKELFRTEMIKHLEKYHNCLITAPFKKK